MIELSGLKGVSSWLIYNKIVFSLVFLRRFNIEHNDQLAIIETLKTCESLEDYKDVAFKLTTKKFNQLNFTQAETITLFKSADDNDKRNMLLEALTITELSNEDCIRLLALHKDDNNVPYSANNIKNVKAADIIPKMIDTLIECSNIDCDFSLMTEDNLKLIKNKRVNINDEAADILSKNANVKTGDLLSLAVKRILARFSHGNA